jgi:hypothetical protein
MLSDESQTPLTQTRDAAADVHTPLSTGDVCSGSLGMGLPLASLGVQLCEASLHQLLPVQSASRSQLEAVALVLCKVVIAIEAAIKNIFIFISSQFKWFIILLKEPKATQFLILKYHQIQSVRCDLKYRWNLTELSNFAQERLHYQRLQEIIHRIVLHW